MGSGSSAKTSSGNPQQIDPASSTNPQQTDPAKDNPGMATHPQADPGMTPAYPTQDPAPLVPDQSATEHKDARPLEPESEVSPEMAKSDLHASPEVKDSRQQGAAVAVRNRRGFNSVLEIPQPTRHLLINIKPVTSDELRKLDADEDSVIEEKQNHEDVPKPTTSSSSSTSSRKEMLGRKNPLTGTDDEGSPHKATLPSATEVVSTASKCVQTYDTGDDRRYREDRPGDNARGDIEAQERFIYGELDIDDDCLPIFSSTRNQRGRNLQGMKSRKEEQRKTRIEEYVGDFCREECRRYFCQQELCQNENRKFNVLANTSASHMSNHKSHPMSRSDNQESFQDSPSRLSNKEVLCCRCRCVMRGGNDPAPNHAPPEREPQVYHTTDYNTARPDSAGETSEYQADHLYQRQPCPSPEPQDFPSSRSRELARIVLVTPCIGKSSRNTHDYDTSQSNANNISENEENFTHVTFQNNAVQNCNAASPPFCNSNSFNPNSQCLNPFTTNPQFGNVYNPNTSIIPQSGYLAKSVPNSGNFNTNVQSAFIPYRASQNLTFLNYPSHDHEFYVVTPPNDNFCNNLAERPNGVEHGSAGEVNPDRNPKSETSGQEINSTKPLPPIGSFHQINLQGPGDPSMEPLATHSTDTGVDITQAEERVLCVTCGRKFLPTSLAVHRLACAKINRVP